MALDAQFAGSAFALEGCPRWSLPEVAIAGRSNVGKSTLINALTASRGLARTSRTPGRTQCLNFFEVDHRFALVDLPGYGYARMPQALAQQLAALIQAYLTRRENLTGLVVLMDCRRGPQDQEIGLIESARARGVSALAVLTKCDKLRHSERAAALARCAEHALEPILCSASNGEGLEALRRAIVALAADDPDRPRARSRMGGGSWPRR